MASMATCPQCGLRVLVPNQTEASSRAKCPDCGTLIDLSAVAPTPIPELIMLDDSPSPKSDQPLVDNAAPTPSETETLESLRSIFAKKDAAKAPRIQLTPTDESVTQDSPAKPPTASAPETKPIAPPFDDVAVAKARHKSETVLKSARDTVAEVQEYLDSLRDDKPEVNSPSFDLPANIDEPPVVSKRKKPPQTRQPILAEKEFDLTDVDLESSAAIAPELLPQPAEEFAEVAPRPRRRRRLATVAATLAILLTEIAAVGGGYHALLRLGGPGRDFLEIAQYIPPDLLPATFAAAEVPMEPSPFVPSSSIAKIKDQPTALPVADRYATTPTVEFPRTDAEPEQHIEPAAFAAPPSAAPIQSTIRLLDAPNFSNRELTDALQAAHDAEAGLIEGSLADRATRRSKGLSYTKFCDLALVLTFLDAADIQGPAALGLTDARQLIQRVLVNEQVRGEVGSIAAVWLDSRHRQHGGILLVGRVTGAQHLGAAYEYQFETTNGMQLTLLGEAARHASLDAGPVAVVGSIVDRPADEIVGYQGSAARVIWVGALIPL